MDSLDGITASLHVNISPFFAAPLCEAMVGTLLFWEIASSTLLEGVMCTAFSRINCKTMLGLNLVFQFLTKQDSPQHN